MSILTKFLLPFLKRAMIFFVGFLMFSFISINDANAQTITPDLWDYPPLSTATFTGTGFWPGETVEIKVKNLNQPCFTVSGDSTYAPWYVTADVNGDFVTTWQVCDCAGDSL